MTSRHGTPGSATFVESHRVVPGEMTVFDAHEICGRVEAAIATAIPESRITIHVEPKHRSKQTGIVILT